MSEMTSNLTTTLTSKKVTDIIAQLEGPFKNRPHLPKGIVDFLVMIAPWLAGIGGVLGIFSGLNLLSSGLGFGVNPAMQILGLSPMYFLISGVFQLAIAGILLLAFRPLQSRQKTGWILMFWTIGLNVLQNIVGAMLAYTMIASLLVIAVGVIIGLYILFEMKSAYK